MKEIATVIAKAHYFKEEYFVVQTTVDTILIKPNNCIPMDVPINSIGFLDKNEIGEYPTFKAATNREIHEHSAGYNLAPEFFRQSNIDPDAMATCLIEGILHESEPYQEKEY